MDLLFVTSNSHKFAEAERVLRLFGVNIEQHAGKLEEIRAESCDEIAAFSARSAYAELKRPLFVEDAGLFVEALHGFPGTYSAWVFRKLGNEGILRLLEKKKDRKAEFVSAVAYCDSKQVEVFVGKCEGEIALKKQGKKGFGYDPIFISNGEQKTFAEDAEMKSKISHRTMAFRKFGKYLQKMKQK